MKPKKQPDELQSGTAFKDVSERRIAAIYADPGLAYIIQKGGKITPEVKDGAVAAIFNSRKTTWGATEEYTLRPTFERHKPFYDVLQREGMKNGVNILASPKLLNQAIDGYKTDPAGSPHRADAQSHYRYVMDTGYKNVTPEMLDDLIIHWKNNTKYHGEGVYSRPETLSALAQEGRLNKEQIEYVKYQIEDDKYNAPTMAILDKALQSGGPDMAAGGVPEIMAGPAPSNVPERKPNYGH